MEKVINAMDDLAGDESTTVVADAFDVSADYVRKLVTGVRKPKTKEGKRKAKEILNAYEVYKAGKSQLIGKVKKLVK